MHVDKQIFEMVEHIKRLTLEMEDADRVSDSGSIPTIATANAVWRAAAQALNQTTQALAALEPVSFPAMAAVAEAAALTGSPTLIYALRDRLLRLAVRQDNVVVEFRRSAVN